MANFIVLLNNVACLSELNIHIVINKVLHLEYF